MNQAGVDASSRPVYEKLEMYEKDAVSGQPPGSPEKQCTIAELPIAADASTGSRQ
jgi:hypothetical protein